MKPYRTRTYISADWDHDLDAVKKLYEWNNNKRLGLSFTNAHELSECRSDETYNCNIKRNCSQNLKHSKNFVLIIGSHTKTLRAGYCMYCEEFKHCPYVYTENKSYIQFECDYAIRNDLPIIVLYKSLYIHPDLCIDSIVNKACYHAPMLTNNGNNHNGWNYSKVKEAFDMLK